MVRRVLSVLALGLLSACALQHSVIFGPPVLLRFHVTVQDAAGAPLPAAHVCHDNITPRESVALDANGSMFWTLPASDFNVCGVLDGYATTCAPVSLHVPRTVTAVLPKWAAPVEPPTPVVTWPPAPRAALPAFPAVTDTQPPNPNGSNGRYRAAVWSRGPYDRDLPAELSVPDQPDLDFHRGNFLGIRVPGLTWHGYGTDLDPTLVTTWDNPRRSVEEQRLILDCYAHVNGYTHFLLSIPQARKAGVLDDAHFLPAAQLAKEYQQFVVVAAFGGDGESWTSDVLPWLDKLVALHALDEVVVCWQCDQHYDPWALLQITKQVGEWAHAHGIKVSQHWVNDAAAWWNADDDPRRPNTCLDFTPAICNRFDYHRVIPQWVDYQYAQFDTEAAIGDPDNGGLQWAIAKLLQSLTSEKLVVAEYDAQAEFDDPAHRTEDQGDLKGYLLMCARGFGRAVQGGYMGGARLPNGRAF